MSCSMKAPKLEDFEFRMERSLNLDEVAALYLETGLTPIALVSGKRIFFTPISF